MDDEKSTAMAEKASKATTSIRSQFEMDCVQTCRSFIRGSCLKTNLDKDPLKCTETHDKPKDEVLCCSMHKPGDSLYNRGFTKCCSLAFGKECEYNHGEAPQAK